MDNVINYNNSKRALEDFYKHFKFGHTPLEARVTVTQNHKMTFKNFLFVDICENSPNLTLKIAMNPKYNCYPNGCKSEYTIDNSKFAFVGNATLLINSCDKFGNDVHLEISPQ